jgi:hypothetical protein
LPISLSPLGLAGCWLRVSPDVTLAVAGNAGSAMLTLPVPNTAQIVGASFYMQAIAPDRGTLALSDAAQAVVGF